MSKNILKYHGFRETFSFGGADVAHWFPGHMAKGMAQLQKKLLDTDCVVEVHDARIPFTGRNPLFKDAASVRPHLFLLNKTDLSNQDHNKIVMEKLRREGLNRILFTDCKKQVTHTVEKRIIPEILNMIKNAPRFHRADAEDYNILIIGLPNVGKSSLINALRRTHIARGKATRVAPIPGETKSVLEKIKVHMNPNIYLYDTPGIMIPKLGDIEDGLKLALVGTLKDYLVGEDIICDYMLYVLNKQRLFKYVEHFRMQAPTDDVLCFLTHIAKKEKLMKRKKTIEGVYRYFPDYNKAAQIALKEFRMGTLGTMFLDKDMLPDSYKNQLKSNDPRVESNPVMSHITSAKYIE